jgi:hypothetical protein
VPDLALPPPRVRYDRYFYALKAEIANKFEDKVSVVPIRNPGRTGKFVRASAPTLTRERLYALYQAWR